MASTYAQNQTTTSSSTIYIETSKPVGKPVKSSQGEEIGTIKDVVIDRSTGCMAYTVLSTGGGGGGRVAGGGGKMVAVPWSVYSPQSDLNTYTVTVERERIFNAPVFDYARIEEYSRPDYINNVYTYYGVSPRSGWRWRFWRLHDDNRHSHNNSAATGAELKLKQAQQLRPGLHRRAITPVEKRHLQIEEHTSAPPQPEPQRPKRETATPSLSERAGERTPRKEKQGKPTPPSSRSETGTRSESAKAPSEQTTTGEKQPGRSVARKVSARLSLGETSGRRITNSGIQPLP